MKRIHINSNIVADPVICHGKPTFKGTRVMVWQVLEMLAEGESVADIIEAFPALKPKHITSALSYASSLTREHYVIINTEAPLPAG